MNEVAAECGSELRRAAYALVIVAACATMTARIAQVESNSGASPLLSANDRSRWAAIRALVDHGTFALDDVVLRADVPVKPRAEPPGAWPYRNGPPANRDRQWYSIDMVRHRGPDGREHYYSSKPPLLNLLLAVPYWLLKQVTGATLGAQPFYVVRILLIALNVIPFALLLAGLAQLVERHGRTTWGRVFVVAAAGFGTLLTPFASTLNNHSFGALAAFGALWCVERVWRGDERRHGVWFAGASLCAALAVVGELPALSLVAAVLVVLAWRSVRATLMFAVPPLVVVGASAFGANYYVHGSWRPPYAHRHDGPVLVSLPVAVPRSVAGLNPAADVALDRELRQALAARGIRDDQPWEWIPTESPARFVLWSPEPQLRWAVWFEPTETQVRQWDNWYEYEGTYWTDEGKAGVDRGEPSRLVYAFHATLGHHGLLSLTPLWLLSLVGTGLWLVRGEAWQRGLALGVAGLTLVVLAFYLARPLVDRNYGGVSCGFRWMIWLVPLWLAMLLPAADRLAASRLGRWTGWVLLGLSAWSAAYSAMNPWTHPWLFQYWTQLGWIAY